MVENWERDLEKGRRGEQITLETLSSIEFNSKCAFEYVGDNPAYYKYGDIKGIREDGSVFMIEVKNDERIADTRNILCEELVVYKDSGDIKDGFMYNYYEYYCIVSEPERKIYVIDFKVLKRIYKRGQMRDFPHKDQTTYGYLLPLSEVKANNGLITILEY